VHAIASGTERGLSPAATTAVILGAGTPTRGQLPAALFDIRGHGRLLDWQIRTLRQSCDELLFVGGYRLADIVSLYPSLHAVVNPQWATTGAVGSLLRALPQLGASSLVSYADILYHDALVRRLCRNTADVTIAVDTRWQQRYEARSPADLAQAEVLDIRDGWLLRAYGPRSPGRPTAAAAEYVGLARLGSHAVAALKGLAEGPGGADVVSWSLPQLLNALLDAGLAVSTVDCEGDWAELNAPQDVARFVLGSKAQTLARLAPLVRHSQIGAQVVLSLGGWADDPQACLHQVRQTLGTARIAVRSSSTAEDGFDASGAGRFETILNVDGADPAALARAIEQVADSYGTREPAQHVLLQQMIEDVAVSGVVMTRTLSHGAPYRVVNYDASSGSTDSVTSGQGRHLRTLYVHRDEEDVRASVPTGIAPLLRAVKEIEALVNHDALDIEFIVSLAQTVHVLQVRPIAIDHAHWRGSDEQVRDALATARHDFRQRQQPSPGVLGKRTLFSVMTDWNPAEMIGTRPRRLAYSLYAHLISDEVWARQRAEYGYRRVAPQALMCSLAGHAYIDVRASFNSFVPAALDEALAERLVDHHIDQLTASPQLHDKVEFDIVPTCLALDFERHAQPLRDAGFSAAEVAALQQALAALTLDGIRRIDADSRAIDVLTDRRARIEASALPPLRKALWLLDDCRASGTPAFAHLARAGFVAASLLRSAVYTGVIEAGESRDFLRSIRTVATDQADDTARLHVGALSQAQFLARYGHLRPGTYEITVPSYAEEPSRYLGASEAALPPPSVPLHAPWSWPARSRERFAAALRDAGLAIDFDAVDRFMRLAIAGRELAKFVFTRNLSLALDHLCAFGAGFGLARDELSHLPLADLRALDAGLMSSGALESLRARAAEGRLAHELANGIELPPLLLDDGELACFVNADTLPNYIGSGTVTAAAICLEQPDVEAHQVRGRIVLIPQADPGYDWLFAQGIAGLVTAFGGANSHMAIRAAEFGLPAAIGVGESRYRQLATRPRLTLDCQRRVIDGLH